MAIIKNSGRQDVICATQVINIADVTPAGVYDAIDIPTGATVIGGDIIVDTPVSGGSVSAATMSVGDASSATRYASAANIFAAGRTALTLTGFKHTATQPTLKVTTAFTGGTTPTAGVIRINVLYVVDGRSHHSHG